MKPPKTLYAPTREAWRRWLDGNHSTEKEIWLICPKKGDPRPKMSYNDAVEEALCYGWIDSTVRSLDETSTIQRYSPRRPGSTYSQPNKERLRWLAGENRLHPSIKAAVQSILSEKYRFPCDILEEIKKDKPAWKNYLRFPDSYRRIRIAYIDSARKRPEEFERRLKSFIAATRRNKMTGYGGIEKYYR